MKTEEQNSNNKTFPQKSNVQQINASFKEQTDWPWKALFRT